MPPDGAMNMSLSENNNLSGIYFDGCVELNSVVKLTSNMILQMQIQFNDALI